jgi:hypothetical protein
MSEVSLIHHEVILLFLEVMTARCGYGMWRLEPVAKSSNAIPEMFLSSHSRLKEIKSLLEITDL